MSSHDTSKPPVSEVALSYSTYFGVATEGRAIAVDSQGNIYVTGYTTAANMPTTPGAFRRKRAGATETAAVVMKLNAAGTQVLYCTYLGGKKGEYQVPTSIAADADGNAYITGFTDASDFPTTPGAFQTVKQGAKDDDNVFVTKVSADGSSLLYSTFIGVGFGLGIAVDSAGNAYVGGGAYSDNFPVTPGAFQTANPDCNDVGFVTKLNPTGSSLVYSTLLEGSNDGADVRAIAVDKNGYAYVTGFAYNGFPVTPGAYDNYSYDYLSPAAVFVSKLNPQGSGLVYSALIGDLGICTAIAIDPSGDAYITGTTTSMAAPVVNAFQNKLSGGLFLRSSDEGANWTSLDAGVAFHDTMRSGGGDALVARAVTALAVDPQDPSRVYAATTFISSHDIFRSSDGGSTWDHTPVDGEVKVIAVDPQNQSNMYAAMGASILRSTDGGASWTPTTMPLNGARVTALVIDPATPSTVYASEGWTRNQIPPGTPGGVFRSTDGGTTWAKLAVSASVVDFLSLAIDPRHPATLFAGSGNGIFKTTDGGQNWSKTAVTNEALSIAIDPSNADIVYASTSGYSFSGSFWPSNQNLSGVLKSTDAGATWNSVTRLEPSGTSSLLLDPGSPSTLYLGLADSGLFKSTDAGQHWAHTKLPSIEAGALAIAPTHPASVYVANLHFPSDAFLAKLDAAGSTLVYATYFGGLEDDVGSGISVDTAGNAYVAGTTGSFDFPLTGDAFQRAPSLDDVPQSIGFWKSFIAKFNPAGGLIFSTLFGGSFGESVNGVAVDSSGSAWITGDAFSYNDMPTVNPIQTTTLGQASALIAKIAFNGSAPHLDLAITGVSLTGGVLIVEGRGFAPGAVITVDGHNRKTLGDPLATSSRLTSTRAGQSLTSEVPVFIQVQNPDGHLSQQMVFMP